MRAIQIIIFLILLSSIVSADDKNRVFKRINKVAITAFPAGTRNYDMYLVSSDTLGNTDELSNILAVTKEKRVRWVVAALDAVVVKVVLLRVFENAEPSENIQTEIVVVSSILTDDELVAAGRVIGADVEFLLLPEESGSK